jgi:hypothetical protein
MTIDIEFICRAVCVAQGIDPDQKVGGGYANVGMTRGETVEKYGSEGLPLIAITYPRWLEFRPLVITVTAIVGAMNDDR